MALIKTAFIYPGDRARAVIPSNVDNLAESMAEVGLINPILVKAVDRFHGGVMRPCYEIVAGGHRYKAAVKLGWDEIDCKVVDMDNLHVELAEIDENIIRANLSPAQEASAISRRKEIYELMHPETKNGGDRVSDQFAVSANCSKVERFTATTAKKTGKSERAIQEAASRGKHLGPDLKAVEGTSLDKAKELDALVKMTPEQRKPLIERAQAGENVSAKKALVELHFAAATKEDIKRMVSKLMKAWESAAPEARKRFLSRIQSD